MFSALIGFLVAANVILLACNALFIVFILLIPFPGSRFSGVQTLMTRHAAFPETEQSGPKVSEKSSEIVSGKSSEKSSEIVSEKLRENSSGKLSDSQSISQTVGKSETAALVSRFLRQIFDALSVKHADQVSSAILFLTCAYHLYCLVEDGVYG
jgi:hypothetical protein